MRSRARTRSVLAAAVVGLAVLGAGLAAGLSGDGSEVVDDDWQRPSPFDTYDPVRAGEPLPAGYREAFVRDQLRPIYRPRFVPAVEAGWPDDALVVALAVDGEAKAYPVHTLNHREMVIDYVGGAPVLVSWCPLCATAMAHRRELDGQEIVLGNQGDLYGNAMTWWDHETGSVWSQPRGEAILGPLAGARLELLPARLTEWGAWRDAHPDTLALDAPGLPTSFRLDDMLIAVELGDDVRGYPVAEVREAGVVSDRVDGVPIAVVVDPRDARRWQVFARSLDGDDLTLTLDGAYLVDPDSGTRWDPARGSGVDGPRADEPLPTVPALTIFPDDFPTFFPDGEVVAPGGR